MPNLNATVIYELIGYTASALVLVSFLMKDVRTIRLVNIFGAIFFVVYGVLTKTWATATMNVALIAVHSYFLIKMRRKPSQDSDSSDS
ncbi:MAG: YgjV family protein [Clostridia bacterium]|nr:YgjV family protein [Clostridia bacterium]